METPGARRKKVTIQVVTRTADSYGSLIESWATYATPWAKVDPLSGKEFFNSQQEQDLTTTLFTFRYSALLAAMNSHDYRIVLNGNTYDLTSPPINVGHSNQEIQIAAVHRV